MNAKLQKPVCTMVDLIFGAGFVGSILNPSYKGLQQCFSDVTTLAVFCEFAWAKTLVCAERFHSLHFHGTILCVFVKPLAAQFDEQKTSKTKPSAEPSPKHLNLFDASRRGHFVALSGAN